MLTHIASFLNHGELPVAALAYSTKQELLLVCDGRYLRLYSAAQAYQCVRAVQLPPTVRCPQPTHTPCCCRACT